MFPPLTGLTFMTWMFVERFSDPLSDSHPIRLLTVVRSIGHGLLGSSPVQGARAPEAQEQLTELACLTLQISPVDRALVISTEETDTPGIDLDRDVLNSECFTRVLLPEIRMEQQWAHLAVVFNRAVLKQSTVSVFLNGVLHSTQKLHYIVQNPGGGAATLTQAQSVNAVIGTPPGPLRKQSQLVWRMGVTHMIEEACSEKFLQMAFRLGPCYTGCFQSAVLPGDIIRVCYILRATCSGL